MEDADAEEEDQNTAASMLIDGIFYYNQMI